MDRPGQSDLLCVELMRRRQGLGYQDQTIFRSNISASHPLVVTSRDRVYGLLFLLCTSRLYLSNAHRWCFGTGHSLCNISIFLVANPQPAFPRKNSAADPPKVVDREDTEDAHFLQHTSRETCYKERDSSDRGCLVGQKSSPVMMLGAFQNDKVF